MRQIIVLLVALCIVSCAEEKPTKDFVLKVKVDGLKKGTVYLERQQDSTFTILDSLAINGQEEIQLTSDLSEPEVLFLRLDKNDKEQGVVVFFADKGLTEISSSLKNFNFDATIKGSKQQEVLDEYLLMMSKFNNRNLDMIKERLESAQNNDSIKLSTLNEDYNSLIKRKYLYTINFAVNHKDSEVAPYLAISEVPNTSINYLQQIYDALEEPIKNSRYGKELEEMIEQRKKEEGAAQEALTEDLETEEAE